MPLEDSSARADPERDAQLMAEVAKSSQAAFVELVRRHQNGLLNFFRRMGVHTDAEDLVQETFLRVFKCRHRYRPTARFTTFLYVLARHVAADHGRRAGRASRLQANLQTDAEAVLAARPGPPAQGLDAAAALSGLSPKLREVAVLNICQGFKYQEVAEILGIPLGTVKSRINMALRELRKIVHENRSQ
jgi:RNA polymerase sigma-70 factor (ECF subfamily)